MESKKKVVISLIIFFSIILLCLLFRPRFKIKNYDEDVTINYKDKYKSKIKVCYGNFFSCKKVDETIKGKVNNKKLGKYNIKHTYIFNNKIYVLDENINVKDLEAPKIELKDNKVRVCPNGKIQDFEFNVSDNHDKDIINKVEKVFDKENNKVIIKVKDSSNNESIKELETIVEDKVKPELVLNGLDNKILTQGDNYNDEGANVKDNCDDDIKIEANSDLNINNPGIYHITYSAKDSSGNNSTIQRTITVKNRESNYKVVYLTFDDGPSEYTNELLDILKKYDVKVTFFVTGRGSDDVIARAYREGHKIALHTNSHDYSYVYSSIDNYYNDLYAIQDRVKRITGETSNIIRFPGGSSNTVSKSCDGGTRIMSTLVNDVKNKGFYYFDWNVSSGDGGGELSTDQVYNNVISTLKSETSVVLQHDTKKWSIDAVPRIIEYCQNNGYIFRTIDETTYGAHHGVSN